MTQGREVTIAGKHYANAAAHIQALLGDIRSTPTSSDSDAIEVTLRPGEELEPEEIEALT